MSPAMVCRTLALLAGLALPTQAAARRILVDPAHGAEPGYETVADLAAVPFGALEPGSEVRVRSGTYAYPVVIAARGTADRPVRIAAEPGARPLLTYSVVIEGAAYVVVEGLTVRGAEHAGFILRAGSAHVTVGGSTVEESGLGIWIGAGAGTGHRITGNVVSRNRTNGIAVDVVNADPDDPSVISGNTITGNGIHGIELNGSGYVVEGNRVSGNGVSMSGTSGIHVYARDAAQDAGDRNLIRYNLVTGQHESDGQDGNGIQLDRFCDGNVVAFNVAWGNDGAGITLFDAGGNLVANNTLTANMRDAGGRHAYKGEIVLAGDYTKAAGRARGNRILNNLVVATRPPVAAIAVEATAVRGGNAVGPNLLHHAQGGPLYWIAGRTGRDAAGSDLSEAPAFADPERPMQAGLALARAPSRPGLPLGPARDIAGCAYSATDARTFGAYREP